MKLWVVEQNVGHEKWSPIMGNDYDVVACKSFKDAHAEKRDLVDCWWDISKAEEKRNFRVVKYERVEK